MLYLVLALFGVLSGVTTVLFGFGGGFVAVPVLYAALRPATRPTIRPRWPPCTSRWPRPPAS